MSSWRRCSTVEFSSSLKLLTILKNHYQCAGDCLPKNQRKVALVPTAADATHTSLSTQHSGGKVRNVKGKAKERAAAQVQAALVARRVAKNAQDIHTQIQTHTHNKDMVPWTCFQFRYTSLNNVPMPLSSPLEMVQTRYHGEQCIHMTETLLSLQNQLLSLLTLMVVSFWIIPTTQSRQVMLSEFRQGDVLELIQMIKAVRFSRAKCTANCRTDLKTMVNSRT
mmetsp:Transcript_5202/g.12447  ORF Transcript_5202/g.12447 Transcript_5202/m.12447 type:complete len:223 (-) Transcript_5202:279-947(-)